jgi:hypothetical protein
MKTLKLIMLSLPALALGCSTPPAGPPATTSTTGTSTGDLALAAATAKAQDTLLTVRHLHNVAQDAPAHNLAEAFPIYVVGLGDLQKYDGASDPEALLQPTNDRFYPVVQDGKVVSSVTLTNVNGAWQPSVIGMTALAGRLHATRANVRAVRAADGDLYGAVKVPALNKHFLIHREGSSMFLTALEDGGTAAPRPAAEVFAGLADSARALPAVQ